MSQHQAFKRVAVPQQVAQQLQTITIPAPTRGIIQNENEAYMQPGGAVVCDNWKPTMKGVSLRGGCNRWAELPETTPVISAFEYVCGNHHVRCVICSGRHEAATHIVGNFADPENALRGALAHVDRP